MADLVDNYGVYVICYEMRIDFCDISLKAATVLWFEQMRMQRLQLKR